MLRLQMLLLIFLLSLCSISQGNTLPKEIAQAIRANGFTTKGMSIFVQGVHDKRPLLHFQSSVARNPASVMKLITTAVSLDQLGPGYKWKTEVYTDKGVVNGTSDGNVYIKGYGDPFMTPEHFWRFLRDLQEKGLKHIKGDIILDTSYFRPPLEDPAAFDNKPFRAYNVTPTALLINFQAIRFTFDPQSQNHRPKITLFPTVDNMKLINQVNLTNGPCGNWQYKMKLSVAQKKQQEVMLRGKFPKSCGKKDYYRVINQGPDYVGGIFRLIWTQLGGSLGGKFRSGRLHPSADLYHTHYSLPLGDLVRGINKYSNNVMTRQVLFTLGAENKSVPGTQTKGKTVIREWLAQHHLLSKKMVMDNGAGLSRRSRVTATQLGELLITVFQKPFMPEFISSLPISSVDGTMSHRINSAPGNIHMKTGILDYVRTQAGYVLSRRGKRYAVVMLHNHPRAHTSAAERIQDILLEWVLKK